MTFLLLGATPDGHQQPLNKKPVCSVVTCAARLSPLTVAMEPYARRSLLVGQVFPSWQAEQTQLAAAPPAGVCHHVLVAAVSEAPTSYRPRNLTRQCWVSCYPPGSEAREQHPGLLPLQAVGVLADLPCTKFKSISPGD